MYDRDWYRNRSGGSGWWHDLHPVGKVMLFLFIGAIVTLFVMNRWGSARRHMNGVEAWEEIMREHARRAAESAPPARRTGDVHDAAARGDVGRLAEILAADPSQAKAVLRKEAPDQPLHKAAWNDQRAAADLLIRFGADVNARGDHGMTPLHYAAKQGSSEVVELLLKRGADVRAKDDAGLTPISMADDPTTKALLQTHNGAKISNANDVER
jgi:hypothetical protein